MSTKEMLMIRGDTIGNKNNDKKDLSVEIDRVNLIWNKYSKDVIENIIIGEILSIQRKLDENKNSLFKSNKNTSNTNENQDYEPYSNRADLLKREKEDLTLKFEIKEPQIIIQNELKQCSILLKINKSFKIYIRSLNLRKDYIIKNSLFVDLIINEAALYSSPLNALSKVFFIGDSTKNENYLEAK